MDTRVIRSELERAVALEDMSTLAKTFMMRDLVHILELHWINLINHIVAHV